MRVSHNDLAVQHDTKSRIGATTLPPRPVFEKVPINTIKPQVTELFIENKRFEQPAAPDIFRDVPKPALKINPEGQDEDLNVSLASSEIFKGPDILSGSFALDAELAVPDKAETDTDELNDILMPNDVLTPALMAQTTASQHNLIKISAEGAELSQEIVVGSESSDHIEATVLDNETEAWTDEELDTFIELLVVTRETTENVFDTDTSVDNIQEKAAADQTFRFEEYIGALEEVDEPIELGYAIMHAEQNTVLETLAIVAKYYRDRDESTLAEDQVIADKICKIVAEIEKVVLVSSQEATNRLILTPALTRQLLYLLRAVGYKEPKLVLSEMVSQHGLDYVLAVMHYLYQLSASSSYQGEFVASKTLLPQRQDSSLTNRIGQFILFVIKSPQLILQIS